MYKQLFYVITGYKSNSILIFRESNKSLKCPNVIHDEAKLTTGTRFILIKQMPCGFYVQASFVFKKLFSALQLIKQINSLLLALGYCLF